MGGALKIIGRVSYALFMAILFLFVYWYTRSLMEDKFITRYGNESLEADDNYFFFYSRIPNYHKSVPIYTFSNDNFEIRAFETAQLPKGSVSDVKESVFFMVHDKNNTLKQTITLRLSNELQDDLYKEIDLRLVRYRSLAMFVAINSDGKMIVDKDLLIGDYTKLTMLKAEDKLYSDTHSFKATDFTIKEALQNYHATHQKLPELELQSENIFKSNPSNLSEYMYIFWTGLAIYFISLIVLTYFIFFFRKKYLGKEKPSVHFNNNNEERSHA